MDDIRDLLLLLYQAHRSWDTVHMTTSGLRDPDWALGLSVPARGVTRTTLALQHGGPTPSPSRDRTAWQSEAWIRRDRQREDTTHGIAMSSIWVSGEWFVHQPPMKSGTYATTGRKPTGNVPWDDMLCSRFLDPSLWLRRSEMSVAGHGRHIGREVIAVRAIPRKGVDDRPPGWLRDGDSLGCDEAELSVDADRGVVLSIEKLLNGKSVERAAVDSIEFDVVLPASLFEFSQLGE